MRGFLARKTSKQKQVESDRVARIELEAVEAVKMQVITGGRYHAKLYGIEASTTLKHPF